MANILSEQLHKFSLLYKNLKRKGNTKIMQSLTFLLSSTKSDHADPCLCPRVSGTAALEEDAQILKVIEAYCTSAKTRQTLNSSEYTHMHTSAYSYTVLHTINTLRCSHTACCLNANHSLLSAFSSNSVFSPLFCLLVFSAFLVL